MLVVRVDKLGDLVMTTPAIAAVKHNSPSVKVTAAITRATRIRDHSRAENRRSSTNYAPSGSSAATLDICCVAPTPRTARERLR